VDWQTEKWREIIVKLEELKSLAGNIKIMVDFVIEKCARTGIKEM
jgi:hypothetical protein